MAKTKEKEPKEMTPVLLKKLVEKRFGKGSMRMASDPSFVIQRLPTGILVVDYMMNGGFARNRHVEIFGSANVGKSATAMSFIATSQLAGLGCAYFDVEKTFDPVFAEHLGVNLKRLTMPPIKHGNRVVDMMETFLRSGLYDVIVLDSIAALLPKSELEADMEAGSYGTQQARLMSAALRRLTTANEQTAIVYINQTREAIGVMYGKKTRTSGGMAMSFYAGDRIEMVKTENIKRTKRKIDPATGESKLAEVVKGHRILIRVEKSKTGNVPFDTTAALFDYDKMNFDPIEDLMLLGRTLGYVHKSKSNWWVEEYEDEKQVGRGKFKKWLRNNVAVAEELRENIEQHIGAVPEIAEDEEEE